MSPLTFLSPISYVPPTRHPITTSPTSTQSSRTRRSPVRCAGPPVTPSSTPASWRRSRRSSASPTPRPPTTRSSETPEASFRGFARESWAKPLQDAKGWRRDSSRKERKRDELFDETNLSLFFSLCLSFCVRDYIFKICKYLSILMYLVSLMPVKSGPVGKALSFLQKGAMKPTELPSGWNLLPVDVPSSSGLIPVGPC